MKRRFHLAHPSGMCTVLIGLTAGQAPLPTAIGSGSALQDGQESSSQTADNKAQRHVLSGLAANKTAPQILHTSTAFADSGRTVLVPCRVLMSI